MHTYTCTANSSQLYSLRRNCNGNACTSRTLMWHLQRMNICLSYEKWRECGCCRALTNSRVSDRESLESLHTATFTEEIFLLNLGNSCKSFGSRSRLVFCFWSHILCGLTYSLDLDLVSYRLILKHHLDCLKLVSCKLSLRVTPLWDIADHVSDKRERECLFARLSAFWERIKQHHESVKPLLKCSICWMIWCDFGMVMQQQRAMASCVYHLSLFLAWILYDGMVWSGSNLQLEIMVYASARPSLTQIIQKILFIILTLINTYALNLLFKLS